MSKKNIPAIVIAFGILVAISVCSLIGCSDNNTVNNKIIITPPPCDDTTNTTPPTLILPANNDSNVSITPTFTWSGCADTLQISLNPTFTNIVHSANLTDSSYTLTSPLLHNTRYYWRAGKERHSVIYWSVNYHTFKTIAQTLGQITFSQNRLKTLSSGNFELWLALDTNSLRTWYSLGRFNISATGTMVDLSGNLMVFRFNGDTNQLGQSSVALVTFETDSDPNPSSYRIMSGSLVININTISGDLLMSGADALGSLGATYLSSPHYIGDYILNSPTTNNAECFKGLWFCDASGVSHFISGLDLPSSSGWKYEGWVIDIQNQLFYSTGKFRSFNAADEDGPGSCPGPNPPFNKPGQEFVTGCPSGTNLNNGNYGVFITLQPNVLSGTPFFIRLFQRDVIQTSLSCGERDVFFRSLGYEGLLPSGHIIIAN